MPMDVAAVQGIAGTVDDNALRIADAVRRFETTAAGHTYQSAGEYLTTGPERLRRALTVVATPPPRPPSPRKTTTPQPAPATAREPILDTPPLHFEYGERRIRKIVGSSRPEPPTGPPQWISDLITHATGHSERKVDSRKK